MRQHIDLAGLESRETLLGRQRCEFDLIGIAQDGSRHDPADLHVHTNLLLYFPVLSTLEKPVDYPALIPHYSLPR